MFTVYKTVENAGGSVSTVVHGSYANRADAEQIADNLRRLYGWVKGVRIESENADAPPTKKMAPSRRWQEPQPRRLSS